jgi:hypothetical protein
MNHRFGWLITIPIAVIIAAAAQNPAEPDPQTAPKLSNQEINDRFVEQITKQIAGHEQDLAAQVFKNIQISHLARIPASNLLDIMNYGYARALGVTCTHCHDEKDFSSDAKRPKKAAREMAAMHHRINEELQRMKNLEPNPEGHLINCNVCHRGRVNPQAK